MPFRVLELSLQVGESSTATCRSACCCNPPNASSTPPGPDCAQASQRPGNSKEALSRLRLEMGAALSRMAPA